MILDNVKERLSQAKENIDFIKECLWQGKINCRNRRT